MLTIPPASLRARGRRPLALTAAVTVATAGLLAGCGSTQAPQPASTGGTASSHQTQQAGAGSSSAAPSTVPGLGGLTVCQSAALKVAGDTSQAGGAAGHRYYPVDFTNTPRAPGRPDVHPRPSFGAPARYAT